MKRTRGLLIVVVSALSLLGLEAPARATTVAQANFHGETLNAFWHMETGATFTDVEVTGVTGRVKGGLPAVPPPPLDVDLPLAAVDIWHYDATTWQELSHYSGYAVIADDDIHVDLQLRTASLTATVVVANGSGSSFPVAIDMAWTASGGFAFDSSRGVERIGDDLSILHLRTKRRDFMNASGTVMQGSTNMTPVPTTEGTGITAVEAGQIFVMR